METAISGGRVYPRGCGGSRLRVQLVVPGRGSIPAGAGGAPRPHPAPGEGRVYPRRCGGARRNTVAPSFVKVYPRRCGGSLAHTGTSVPRSGLSPHLRGELRLPLDRGVGIGAIPAGAGGAAPCRPEGWRGRAGLSPQVRGELDRNHRLEANERSIPAGAGGASAPDTDRPAPWVYPRRCGGSCWRTGTHTGLRGLSPQVRGEHLDGRLGAAPGGSIPAGAGGAIHRKLVLLSTGVYPRRCGGSASVTTRIGLARGLAPQVRGELALAGDPRHRPGSIPAGAGGARTCAGPRPGSRVYPRRCGGSRRH